MDLVTILIVLSVVGGIVLLATGTIQTVQHSRSPVEQRLETIRKRTPVERELGTDEMSLSEREESQRIPRRADLLPLMTRLLSRNAMMARLEADLDAARSNWRASEIVYASLVITAVVFLILTLIFKNLIIASLLSLPALAGPFIYVRRLRAKYLDKFGAQLADTLTLMSNALRSGYSFNQAMEMVAREADPPMSDEFKRVADEIQVGKTVEEAMDNLGKRINSADLNLMVTAVLIQREVGGALAEILDTIAEVIRERVRIQGEIRTLTTQGRISGLFLAFMPIGLGLAVNVITKLMSGGTAEPYMAPLLNTKAGHWMIGIGLVMQVIGFFVIKRIVTIEV